MSDTLQYTFFIVLAPLAALLLISLLAYARLAFPSPETNVLNWLLVTIAGWLIFNTLELVASTEAASVFWAKVSYPFITFSSVAWLGFALQFSDNHQWRRPRRFLLFCVLPFITNLLVWTNEWHLLHWEAYHFTPIGNMLAFSVDFGPWFWVHMSYSYLLVFVGAFLIIRQYFRSFRLYRQQSIWVVIGALVPIFVNLIYVLRLFPAWQKDYTSVSFAIAGMAFAVGVFRYRLFDLRPVVREALVDSMQDVMIALDNQDRVIDINPTAQALLGIPSDDVIGQPAREVFAAWRDQIDHYWDQKEIHAEVAFKVGEENRCYDLQVSPLMDQRGRSVGRLAVLHNITDLKQAEAELRRFNEELESSNNELDAFAQTVAHDLKSPLNSLNMALYLLQANYGDLTLEEMQQTFTSIENISQKIVNIVDALLLLSSVRKIDDMTVIPLDTEKIVDEALKRLRELSKERQAEFVKPEDWPVALGYPPWVEEVWVNYLSNAIKYGGTPLRIELGADHHNGHRIPMIRFWVRDNGPGIAPDRQENVFLPFTRLGDLRVEGHGLGLSIALRIVTKLRGEVGIESQEGQGSLFWFTLPAYLSEEQLEQFSAKHQTEE